MNEFRIHGQDDPREEFGSFDDDADEKADGKDEDEDEDEDEDDDSE